MSPKMLRINEVQVHELKPFISVEMGGFINSQIAQFSKAMSQKGQSSDFYKNERGASRALDNILSGKMGEEAAALVFHQQFGFQYVRPDYSVFGCGGKSWAADLNYSVPPLRVHVKTYTDYFNGKMSWVFQNGDQLHQVGDEHDLCAFVHIDTKKNSIQLMATSPWLEVKKMLKPMTSIKYQGSKKAIYWEDLNEAAP